MLTVQDAVMGDLDQEMAVTRKTLERIPDAHWNWKPHEKSMTRGALAAHIANILSWMITTLDDDDFDLASAPRAARSLPVNREALLAQFDDRVLALRKSMLESMRRRSTGRGRCGMARCMSSRSPGASFRNMCTSHLIHHRAQLGVYLRLLDVPLPMTYGPSADETGGF